MLRFSFLTALLFLTLSSPARADKDNPLMLPPEGHVLINLSATETRKLVQDQLIASLRIEKEDVDVKKVQDDVNKAMKAAIEASKKYDSVKVSTGGYNVYKNEQPIPDPKTGQYTGKVKTTWRASQTLDMESKDSASMLELTGQIQELGFAMSNLMYTLSPEKAEAVRDELMVIALKKLRAKAEKASDALGKKGFELTDVNLDTSGGYPPPMPYARSGMEKVMMSAQADAMAAPVADAGESSLSLTVSARALLKP
ncbi:MAG: SIMPL domain-containing protein [Alphaproteobacteria bacterium]|nr:SIMPL domain-containing protein [Alphaproteobacteria bacterium]